MNRVLAILVFAALACAVAHADAPKIDQLRPGMPAEVYVAPGRSTTILFHTEEKVAAISLASPIVTYKYDKALNQLELTPAVRTGGVETNLNLRIGPNVYVLLVKVVTDVRAQFLRTFALPGDPAADEEGAATLARPLKPSEVDIVGAAQALERAQSDPVFQKANPNLRIESLQKRYQWNDCLITLVDVAQFADQDLLVFRVQWVNRTNDALYLDARQYGLYVADRPVPIIARYRRGAGAIVRPGQLETVFLAVQGYRLSRHNDWRLGLPPDSRAVAKMQR